MGVNSTVLREMLDVKAEIANCPAFEIDIDVHQGGAMQTSKRDIENLGKAVEKARKKAADHHDKVMTKLDRVMDEMYEVLNREKQLREPSKS